MSPPTFSPYLIGVEIYAPIGGALTVMVMDSHRLPLIVTMRLERLPGIHHDSACIIVSGKAATVIIDTGTSWYQSNLLERIRPHIKDRSEVTSILLSHRHFDTCGAAPYLSAELGAEIWIHESAVAPLEGADLFTTWASRYGSDMPPIQAQGFSEGLEFDLGDSIIEVIHTPGHTLDSCSFIIKEKETVICGDLIPSAGYPTRADMPTGNLLDLKRSLEKLKALKPRLIVCGRGEAISGKEKCKEVLTKHIESVVSRIEASGDLPDLWPRPAETCHWLSPEPAWEIGN